MSDLHSRRLQQGLDYLYLVRSLAIDPDLIDAVFAPDRELICLGIAAQIQSINAQLARCLQLCHACLHPHRRPEVQILAAPFSDRFAIDALCNLHTIPLTILIDVGRLSPHDWIALVVHEYAHACLGRPGHDSQFAQLLAQLCLALDLPDPTSVPHHLWPSFPSYPTNPAHSRFWRSLIP